ncbi:MAG: DUF4926 domain-containing protein [Janthinobacterium lividum]
MFQFSEGDLIALREDYPVLGLRAGDKGIVWMLYDTEPPAYDVTFSAPNGRSFDMVVNEEEIEAVPALSELTAANS